LAPVDRFLNLPPSPHPFLGGGKDPSYPKLFRVAPSFKKTGPCRPDLDFGFGFGFESDLDPDESETSALDLESYLDFESDLYLDPRPRRVRDLYLNLELELYPDSDVRLRLRVGPRPRRVGDLRARPRVIPRLRVGPLPRPPTPTSTSTTSRSTSRPQVRQDHPVNLSILMTGGKETNWDVLSSGERRGRRSNLKSGGLRTSRIVVLRSAVAGTPSRVQALRKGGDAEGEGPVRGPGVVPKHGRFSESRAVWECSPNRVIDLIQS
jgi:hypothetical protein